MSTKKSILLLSILFVLMIVGASALYQKLGTDYRPDSLKEIGTVDSAESNSGSTDESQSDPDNTAGSDNTTSDDSSSSDTTRNNPAPDFTVTDIDGNEVNLSDFKGKPVVLNFWASWCGPCKSEMPEFDEVYQKYKDTVEFMIVNLTDGYQETVKTASAYIIEQGYSFPVYYDTKSDAANTYYVYSIPTTYFIDAEGNMVAQAQGAIDKETLLRGIEMIKK